MTQPQTSAVSQPLAVSGRSKMYLAVSWLYLVSGIAILARSLMWSLPLYFHGSSAILSLSIAPITLILSGLALYALADSKKGSRTVIGLLISIVIFFISIFSQMPSALSNYLVMHAYPFLGIFSLISLACFFDSLRENKNNVLAWVILSTVIAYILIPYLF